MQHFGHTQARGRREPAETSRFAFVEASRNHASGLREYARAVFEHHAIRVVDIASAKRCQRSDGSDVAAELCAKCIDMHARESVSRGRRSASTTLLAVRGVLADALTAHGLTGSRAHGLTGSRRADGVLRSDVPLRRTPDVMFAEASNRRATTPSHAH